MVEGGGRGGRNEGLPLVKPVKESGGEGDCKDLSDLPEDSTLRGLLVKQQEMIEALRGEVREKNEIITELRREMGSLLEERAPAEAGVHEVPVTKNYHMDVETAVEGDDEVSWSEEWRTGGAAGAKREQYTVFLS